MLKNKSVIVIAISVIITTILIGTFAIGKIANSRETFQSDGYILVPSEEELVTTDVNNQFYFSAGTKYLEKYGDVVSFKDTQGADVSVNNKEFLHYLDGSLGALTKGVLLEANGTLSENQVAYYSVSKNTTVLRNGNLYSMATLDNDMEMSSFVWKISDVTYMVVAPEVIFHLDSEKTVSFPDYVQLEYVESGIVRLIHQQGTYQTVSSEAYLELPNDVTLNLSGRKFYVSGEEGVSLESMVIGSEENVALAENKDEVKMPTFNVVNGANGTNGTTGEDGEIGEEGESGEEGDVGADGDDGTAGKKGGNGTEGDDGAEGDGGNDGEKGYDGANGHDGQNADNPATDGSVGVDQLRVPTISVIVEGYHIGTNNVSIPLQVTDEDQLLTSKIKTDIYETATNELVYSAEHNQGSTQIAVTTQALKPNTDYILIVTASYSKDGSGDADTILDGSFLVKQFRTDSLGVSLQKVKATENSIEFNVVFDKMHKVSTYQVVVPDALANGDPWKLPDTAGITDGGTASFIIDNLQSNKEYTISLCNLEVISENGSTVSMAESSISLDVKTLKKTPYHAYSDVTGDHTQKISEVRSFNTLNDRDKTLGVGIPELVDIDQGIMGYRYELYETNNVNVLQVPVQVAESTDGKVRTFSIEKDKTYTARVVVIFYDNEKKVEFATLPPAGGVFKLADGTFPVVSYEIKSEGGVAGQQQEMLRLNVKISDPNGMLLGNVSEDYPIRITFANSYGDSFSSSFYTSILDANNFANFYVQQEHLRKDTDYTITVTGPVNTTNTVWSGEGGLNDEQRDKIKNTYLSGVQFKTSQTAQIDLIYFDVSAAYPAPFAVAVNTRQYTADQVPAGDITFNEDNNSIENTAYVLKTLNKMTFELYDKTGKKLGESSIYDIEKKDVIHGSEFYDNGYSNGTVVNENYTPNLVLTPSSFNVADSMLQSGDKYTIKLVNVQDYVGNDLEFVQANASVEVEMEEKHTVATNPNAQIDILEITNGSVKDTARYNVNISDDTVIGMKLVPAYTLGDVLKVAYVAYEVTDITKAPKNTDIVTLNNASSYAVSEIGKKTISCGTVEAATAGNSTIGSGQYLNIYFDETQNEFDTNGDGIYDDSVTFKRGQQYLFKYEITTAKEHKANCHDGSEDDLYPYCVYLMNNLVTTKEDVPFYRSPMYCAERQKPEVECYPAVSDGTSITWDYRIIDNDGAAAIDPANLGKAKIKVAIYNNGSSDDLVAIDKDGDGKIYRDAENNYYDENPLNNRTPISLTSSVKEYTCATVMNRDEAFQPIQFTGFTFNPANRDHIRYRVSVPYRIVSGQVAEYIVSDIHRFKKKNTVANPTAEGTKETTIALKSIEDFGGGEIKLIVYGEGIERCSALKVVVRNDADAVNPEVVYDPVPIEIQSAELEGVPQAFAYLNYKPLSAWQKQEVDVSIYAYYDTYAYAMDFFEDDANNDTTVTLGSNGNAIVSKVFSLLNEKDAMYMNLGDQVDFVNISRGVATSLFVADTKKEFQKYNEETGMLDTVVVPAFVKNGSDTVLRMQYAYQPIIVAKEGDLVVKNTDIAFDENGMFIRSSDPKNYIAIKELQTINVGTKSDFYLEEQLPTVESVKISTGVKTANLSFGIAGNVTADTEIFAEIYNTTLGAKALDVTGQTDSTTGKHYYAVGNKGSNGNLYYDDYFSGSFNEPYTDIPFKVDYDSVTGKGTYDITFTNLTPSVIDNIQSYSVRLYVKKKDINGDIITTILQGSDEIDKKFFLYDEEKRMSGRQYTFSTRENVLISIQNPIWTYEKYSKKYGTFAYKIEGAGMGYDMFFSLKNMSTLQELVTDQELPKIGSLDAFKHYGSEFDLNAPIVADMNPGVGPLVPDTEYQLTINAVDNMDFSNIGTKTLTFRTEKLKRPTSKYNVIASANSLTVSYAMTDANRVIMNNANNSTAGPYKLTVSYLENDETKERVIENRYGLINETITELPSNKVFNIKITAPVDMNNDGIKDEEEFVDEFSGETKSASEASVNAYIQQDNFFVLYLDNLSNFSNVQSIKYTFYAQNGTNIGSGTVDMSSMLSEDEGYAYVTDIKAPRGNERYYVSAIFYDTDGNIAGNELNVPFHIGSLY